MVGVWIASSFALALGGCAEFGQAELGHDQVGYSQTLSDSTKDQMLLNIVRLRYGDTPVFLTTTQVIAGYQLQRNITAGVEAYPSAAMSTFLNGGGSVQLQQSPTFTFEPVRGQAFAQSYLRKLPPEIVFSIIDNGLPIDVVLRLTLASINDYQNSNALAANDSKRTTRFLQLLSNLRQLQLDGQLDVKQTSARPEGTPGSQAARSALVMTIANGRTVETNERARVTRKMLGLAPQQQRAEVISGKRPDEPGQIAVDTRAVLGVMGAVGFDIDVPQSDVDGGITVPSISTNGVRPPILILSSEERPRNAFAAGRYKEKWFYIPDDDFQSKIAFGVVQIVSSLAESSKSTGAVVTVPAR